MKKFLKIFGIVFLVLIILIIALPFMFKGKIVSTIKEEANNNLNAKVDFGTFDLSLISSFPDFSFEINDVKVEGIDKFEGVTLASIKHLNLTVDLMSVISGDEINVKTIHIDQPIIKAIVLADSTANWDIAKTTDEASEEAETTSEESSSFKLGLKDLTISDADIYFKDATMDFVTHIKNFDFHLTGDMTADQTNMDITSAIEAMSMTYEGIDYFNKAKVDLVAGLDADLANSKYVFRDNKLTVNDLEINMDGWFKMLEESYDMDLKFNAPSTDFKTVLSLIPAVYMTDFASVKTAGKFNFNGFAKGTYKEDVYPQFALDLKVDKAMFKYPGLPKSVNNINIDLHVDNPGGSDDNTNIDLKKFHMEMAGNPIDAILKLTTPVSDPNIDSKIKMYIDLASFKDILPKEGNEDLNLNGIIKSDLVLKGKISSLEQERYEEFTAKGMFGIEKMKYVSDSLPYDVNIENMVMNFSPQFVELADFKSTIGKSDMNAKGRLDNVLAYALKDNEILKGTFNFNANYINVDEFISSEETTEEGAAGTEGTTEEEPLEVVEIPVNIDFTLNSTINKLIYDSLEINNIKGQLVIKDQKLSMKDVAMDLLGGSMVMSGYYETSNPKEPTIDFYMDIKDFDVNQVSTNFNTIEKLAPVAKATQGRFSTKLKITGKLDDKMEPKLDTYNGYGTMVTNNIKVKDFKPLVKLAEALKKDQFKSIELSNQNIEYEIVDGKVVVKPFNIDFGKTKGTLGGTNSLDQSIDYTMKLKIPKDELGGAANNLMNSLSSQAASNGIDLNMSDEIDLDVKILGTFFEPKISTGLAGAKQDLKSSVKDEVENKINEVKDDAKQKLQEQADKIMKDAEEQANKIRQEGKNAAQSIRDEADKQAQQLIDDAGNNFLKKKAAEVAAEKIRKEADKKAQKVEEEANKKADQVMAKAQEKADALLKK
ncbi:MAG: AsmA-like C-terminal region-containing protein [Vicingaceae bacterium]